MHPEPYGGSLVNLLVKPGKTEEIKQASRDWPSYSLTPEQLGVVELLATGALSPLTGFMDRDAVLSVLSDGVLPDGTPWPMPVVLSVPKDIAEKAMECGRIALRDREGVLLGIVKVSSTFSLPEASPSLGGDEEGTCIAGGLEVVELPHHYDFRALRLSPSELRKQFSIRGWRRVLLYLPEWVVGRAELEGCMMAASKAAADVLIQASVDAADADDITHYGRMRALSRVIGRFPPNRAMLSILPYRLNTAGGWRWVGLAGVIARNQGCTHLFVEGRAQAGSARFLESVGVELLEGSVGEPSSARIRRLLAAGAADHQELPEVVEELAKVHPPRSRQGFTVFFTGLSGAGKSTLANVLKVKLLELGTRPVTLLDGDIVRKNLSSELGFSKEHRDLNIRRIGFVASEITKNGGVAICAPIAPYDEVRKEVRKLISRYGGFVLVWVSTPLEVCEARDRKGLYAKARAGIIKGFTGIDDPYEPPDDAEIVIDTTSTSPEEGAHEILLYLEKLGYITAPEGVAWAR